MKSPAQGDRSGVMFTSADCRAMAEQKLAQAERDDHHRQRLITAAEGWLLLASKLKDSEALPHSEDAPST
jgi:hypothetical protein